MTLIDLLDQPFFTQGLYILEPYGNQVEIETEGLAIVRLKARLSEDIAHQLRSVQWLPINGAWIYNGGGKRF